MIDQLKLISIARLRVGLMLLALAIELSLAATRPLPVPQADSVDYLAYARSLALTGSYARTPSGPTADSLPGREPLYPAVIALTAYLSPELLQTLSTCTPPSEECHGGFRILVYLNGFFLALTVCFSLLILGALRGNKTAHLVTAGYLILNLHITKDMKYVISDFLAMALLALACWLVALAWGRREVWRWLAAASALSALALTKASFLPMAALLALGLALAGIAALRREGPRALLPALALGSVLLATNGGWIVRNHVLFGIASDSRNAIALSTREVFNHMTPQEHLAAWVWWTRGPGNGLAKTWFPREVWERHEWYSENGFYIQGQVIRHQQRIDRVRAEHPDWPQSRILAQVSTMVAHEILVDWPSYLSTMPVMIYRGLWCDEFTVIGFPLLVLICWRAFRFRRWDILVVLGAGWWSILFYPAVSLNIPRYQMTSLIALALAAGLAAQGKWAIVRTLPAPPTATRSG